MKFLSNDEFEKRVSDSYEFPNNVKNTAPHPMVTIRTTTYQHLSFIKECIEGVLMQKTNFPIEFIIGEDFSTDGTREIVFEYAKKYPDIIRVITADYNVGIKVNGQRCLRASRGKYMAQCDGDDYWTDPLKLQKQVDFLEANPDYVLTYHNYKNVDGKGNFISNRQTPLPCTLMFINDFSSLPPIKDCPNGDKFIETYFSLKGSFKYLGDIAPSIRRCHEGGIQSMIPKEIKLDRQAKTWDAVYHAFKDSKLGNDLFYKKNTYAYKKMLYAWGLGDLSILNLIRYPIKVKQLKLYVLFAKNLLGRE